MRSLFIFLASVWMLGMIGCRELPRPAAESSPSTFAELSGTLVQNRRYILRPPRGARLQLHAVNWSSQRLKAEGIHWSKLPGNGYECWLEGTETRLYRSALALTQTRPGGQRDSLILQLRSIPAPTVADTSEPSYKPATAQQAFFEVEGPIVPSIPYFARLPIGYALTLRSSTQGISLHVSDGDPHQYWLLIQAMEGQKGTLYLYAPHISTQVPLLAWHFEVVAPPVTFFVGYPNQKRLSLEALQKSGIMAAVLNLNVDLRYSVLSFTMRIQTAAGTLDIPSEGARFGAAQAAAAAGLSSGSPLVIRQLYYQKQNGEVLLYPKDLVFYLE